MDSIQALLQALKQHEASGGEIDAHVIPLGSTTSITKIPLDSDKLDLSDLDDATADTDGTDDDDQKATKDAAIVNALQTQYPKIYAKISAEVSPSSHGDDATGDAQYSDMVN